MSDRHDKKRATMAAKLASQTGRSVDEWVAVVNEAAPAGFTATVDWLKSKHQLGHFQARLVAEAHRDQAQPPQT